MAVEETVLGSGAYGKVLKMKLHDDVVAGKIMYSDYFDYTNDSSHGQLKNELFKQECVRMSQLRHPNIVQFLGVHYKSGSDIPILIMEYLPMSLTNYLEKNETIPNHIKNSILLDVSYGLLYLHTQTPPILHYDLTANNVLLTSDMTPITAKITDFGVSCIIKSDRTKYHMIITKSHICMYMPPEALAHKSDYKETRDNFDKIDVFSFGVLILHVYTQQWPKPTGAFDEHNMPRSEVQRRQHLLDKVKCDNMKQLAEKCLQNSQEDRPHTFDLVRSIEEIMESDVKLKIETETKSLKEKKSALENVHEQRSRDLGNVSVKIKELTGNTMFQIEVNIDPIKNGYSEQLQAKEKHWKEVREAMKTSHEPHVVGDDDIDGTLCICGKQLQSLEEYSSALKKSYEEQRKILQDAENKEDEIIKETKENINLIKNAYSELLEARKKYWRETSHLLDPDHNQLKREGSADQSTKSKTMEKIEKFFNDEYIDIVETQLNAKEGDDFLTDETLKECIKKCYKSVKEATVGAVCDQINDSPLNDAEKTLLPAEEEKLRDVTNARGLLLNSKKKDSTLDWCDQIYDLFKFDPHKVFSPDEEERLRDVSHAYGLLLFHYKKQDPNFKKIKDQFEQDLNDGQIKKFKSLFLEMMTVSPPIVLFVPDQYDDGCLNRTQLFTACYIKRKKEPHPFHVRIPIILESYRGRPCVEGLVCKGFQN